MVMWQCYYCVGIALCEGTLCIEELRLSRSWALQLREKDLMAMPVSSASEAERSDVTGLHMMGHRVKETAHDRSLSCSRLLMNTYYYATNTQNKGI